MFFIILLEMILLLTVPLSVFSTCISSIYIYVLDHLAIVNNKDTDPTVPFHQLWGNDIWGKVVLHCRF